MFRRRRKRFEDTPEAREGQTWLRAQQALYGPETRSGTVELTPFIDLEDLQRIEEWCDWEWIEPVTFPSIAQSWRWGVTFHDVLIENGDTFSIRCGPVVLADS